MQYQILIGLLAVGVFTGQPAAAGPIEARPTPGVGEASGVRGVPGATGITGVNGGLTGTTGATTIKAAPGVTSAPGAGTGGQWSETTEASESARAARELDDFAEQTRWNIQILRKIHRQ